MAFSEYISKVKEMFNIYFECNEAFSETRKLRFLWELINRDRVTPLRPQLGSQNLNQIFLPPTRHA
jgi:hypothetical protein